MNCAHQQKGQAVFHVNIATTNPPRLPRIKTACAEHVTEHGQKLSDIKPGQSLAVYRAHGMTIFMTTANTALLLWAILWCESLYWTGYFITLCSVFYAWILTWEAFRLSRTVIHASGITRRSWFYGTFYPWESIQHVVWASKYVGKSVGERIASNNWLPGRPGIFFIDINGNPRFSARFIYIYHCDRILDQLPDSIPVQKYDEKITSSSLLWHDITPFWQRCPIRQMIIELLGDILIYFAPFATIPLFHYLNEHFFHLPK